MIDTEFVAWQSFVLVTQNFLGKQKQENYQELVEVMLFTFKDLDVKMRIRVHHLFSHLDCFSTKLGDLNEEHGERFRQDIKVMKERYQGRCDAHMMTDHCWSLLRDFLAALQSKKSCKRKFVNID